MNASHLASRTSQHTSQNLLKSLSLPTLTDERKNHERTTMYKLNAGCMARIQYFGIYQSLVWAESEVP